MIHRRTVALLATLVASGCYESEFPLEPTPVVAINQAVVGTWRCLPADGEAKDKPATVAVEVTRERVYGVTWTEEGDSPERYEAYESSLGVPRVLNVHEVADGKASGSWVFVRYTLLRPRVLELQVATEDSLRNVGKTPAALRQAITRQANPSLFADFAICARVDR